MNLTAASRFLHALFQWTWQTSLHAAVLILLTGLIQVAGGRWLAPRWRYALGVLVLVRLMLPVVPTSALSVFNLAKSVLPPASHVEVRSGSSLAMPPSPIAGPADDRGVARSGTGTDQKIDRLRPARAVWLLGVAVSLLMVLRQQRKFARHIAAEPAVSNERILSLLESCRTVMGVRRQIRMVMVPQLGAPALFGFLKPSLLLPQNAFSRLADSELRMIFLHELAHVKRGDILLNWVIIAVRSLHWFNPLVWLALRRLRADRELVCDAMVLTRLGSAERFAYGNTLIKLLDDFSGSGFCPSLAPVINHKQEIKRRVIMIAHFKPTGRIAWLFSAAIVLALCALTFTRAAEKKGVPAGNAKNRPTAESAPANAKSQSSAQVSIENLKKLLQEKNDEVKEARDRTDQLRKELRISDAVAADAGSITLNPETVRRLEAARIEVESQYRGLNSLVTLLRVKSDAELQKIIIVTVPDEVLTSLLKAKFGTEQRLANLSTKFGDENPEIKASREASRKINEQIAERVQGLLAGLEVRAAAMKAQMESLDQAVDGAKARELELAAKYRPYFEAKRRLENLEKIRDAIFLRLLQERIDATLPGRKQ